MNITEVPKLAIVKGGKIIKVLDQGFDRDDVLSHLD